MADKIKHKLSKTKIGLKKIPIAIISLVFGAFFLTFLALFIRKKGKKNKK